MFVIILQTNMTRKRQKTLTGDKIRLLYNQWCQCILSRIFHRTLERHQDTLCFFLGSRRFSGSVANNIFRSLQSSWKNHSNTEIRPSFDDNAAAVTFDHNQVYAVFVNINACLLMYVCMYISIPYELCTQVCTYVLD